MRARLPAALFALCVLISAAAETPIPTVQSVFSDDFESGSLDDWVLPAGHVLGLAPGSGRSGSAALRITLSQDESHVVRGSRRNVARATEAYLTFWFHPNGADLNDTGTGYIPNRAVQIAALRGPGRGNMVAIRFREVAGGFEGFLEWRDPNDVEQYDFHLGSFEIANRWQEITIGFRKDEWVSCWIDGVPVRTVHDLSHLEPFGSLIEVGKTNPAIGISPTGSLLFDEVRLEVPRHPDLWVDASSGDDGHDGLTPGTAFATISRASDLAGAGTTVHIQPGIYRETVVPAQGGLSGEPSIYRAEAGPGTVTLRGSEPGASLGWQRLASNTVGLPASVDPQNVWWADLSAWELAEAPGFVVTTDGAGAVLQRLPAAREPDWTVSDPQQTSLHWWIADGGSSIPACDPTTDADRDCDAAARSSLQLLDRPGGPSAAGLEAGDLTTLGSLVGATIFVRESAWGQLLYRRTLVGHDVAAGRVTVDEPCLDSTQTGPGLGWGSQYFVEGHPALLDNPGEWWYDPAMARLYLWPPIPGDPVHLGLEISRRDTAFDLDDRSHVTLQDLDFDLFQGDVVQSQNLTWHSSVGLRIVGSRFRHSDRGVLVSQAVEAGTHGTKRTEGFVLEDSVLSHLDYEAIRITYRWDDNSDIDQWSRPGVFDTQVRGNEIYNVGFRIRATGSNHAAIVAFFPERLTIQGNTFRDLASSGIEILKSVVQSPDSWGFSPEEIKVGSLLIRGNTIDRACQLKNDCGGLRFLSTPPDTHVFRDALVMDNSFRDTLGWSWTTEHRGRWSSGQIPGAGGLGLYLDHASGIHVYRNVLYNNGFAGVHLAQEWRDGPGYFFNNVAANNAWGLHMGGLFKDTHIAVDSRVKNNILINNEAFGLGLEDLDSNYTNLDFDHNLYHLNGWRGHVFSPGAMRITHDGSAEHYLTLPEIQAGTPFEDSGQAADPLFLDYDPDDRNRRDGSRPDFRLRSGSPALDAGTTSLPQGLVDILAHFGITDLRIGAAWDQGAFEGHVDCGSEVVSNQVISTIKTFTACSNLTLGPDFQLIAPGNVTALAGQRVILTSGFSVASGASFVAGRGGLPD